MRYSIFSLARNAASRHENWPLAWRSPEPKRSYDAIVVGGGGHGLATAYYLAKEHGISNVAVLEKGWLGGGNTGRNTTIVRSNYHLDANAHFYEFSLKLWEGLSQELNFNVMYSARGVLNLVHSPADMDAAPASAAPPLSSRTVNSTRTGRSCTRGATSEVPPGSGSTSATRCWSTARCGPSWMSSHGCTGSAS